MHCEKCGMNLHEGGTMSSVFKPNPAYIKVFLLLIFATLFVGCNNSTGLPGIPGPESPVNTVRVENTIPASTPTPIESLNPTATPAPVLSPSPAPAPAVPSIGEEAARKAMGEYIDDTVVVFADSVVEAWIRRLYITKAGDITVGDMKGITEFSYARRVVIGDERIQVTETISTIFDLRYCVNLEEIFIHKQPITSVEGLRNLEKLRVLDIEDCEVSDLSPLTGKASLRQVIIPGNPVTDASPVLGLPNLSSFNAYRDTGITDISALAKTSGLISFTCPNTLKDYSPLLHHTKLGSVSLSGISNKDFVALMDSLKGPKFLFLHDSEIDDASLALLKDHKIELLTLKNCGIGDLTMFPATTNIRKLDLSDNNIKDYSPLIQVKKLSELRVAGNPVTDDDTLKTLEKYGCTVFR